MAKAYISPVPPMVRMVTFLIVILACLYPSGLQVKRIPERSPTLIVKPGPDSCPKSCPFDISCPCCDCRGGKPKGK